MPSERKLLSVILMVKSIYNEMEINDGIRLIKPFKQKNFRFP
jgi:hypothetical protein